MYAMYCMHKLGWTPSRFSKLPLREKALVAEMIDERLRQEGHV